MGTGGTPVQSGHVDFYVDNCGVQVCSCPVVQYSNITSPLNCTDQVIADSKYKTAEFGNDVCTCEELKSKSST